MKQKIVWLSDLHFTAEGLVQGHDPRVRLRAAIGHINTHHHDAVACVISGDMVDRGTDADYAALAVMLADLHVPYFPMVGNHDNRASLRAHLPVPDTGMSEFVQYALALDHVQIICLDTQDTGVDSGAFCAVRQRWLDAALANETPTIIFMHHPPVALDLPMQDQDRLLDADRFLRCIRAQPHIRYLCMGHVHRPITGIINTIPFATMRSVLYQAPPPQPPWDWSSFAPAQEAPDLGIVTLENDNITLQYQSFCPYEKGTES